MSSFKLHPILRLRNLIVDLWREDKDYFLGRTLTIIDASIQDREQRKAIKDLIKNAFYELNYREDKFREILWQFFVKYGQDIIGNNTSEGHKDLENMVLGRVSEADSRPVGLSYFSEN